jgi:hypothetical protein
MPPILRRTKSGSATRSRRASVAPSGIVAGQDRGRARHQHLRAVRQRAQARVAGRGTDRLRGHDLLRTSS